MDTVSHFVHLFEPLCAETFIPADDPIGTLMNAYPFSPNPAIPPMQFVRIKLRDFIRAKRFASHFHCLW
jgi:hypothetical protein